MRGRRLIGLVLVGGALTGCGLSIFAEPKTNPILEDRVGKWGRQPVATLATTAERRVVLVNINQSKPDSFGRMCAEPPPDAAENIASQMALAVAAAGESPQVGAELRLQFGKQLATTLQSLFHRTQGVQLYRDGLFSLCQLYWNGVITPDEYAKRAANLLETSRELIEKELDLTQGTVGGPPVASAPVLSPLELGDVDLTRSTSADRIRAQQLIAHFRSAKRRGDTSEIKVALTGLHEILVTRNSERSEKDRTLPEADYRAILDRLRPLAKDEASRLSLVTMDGLKGKDTAQFIGLFM